MRSEERKKQLGEVFTPQFLVERMLNKLQSCGSDVLTNYKKTVLDNSCGNGNFLVEILQQRMMNGISHKDALSTIYGIDIDELNIKECRTRLLLGKNNKKLKEIVEHNIILADALDSEHIGWNEVGYMWSGKLPQQQMNKKFLDI